MGKKNAQSNVYVHSIINKFLYCLVSFFGNIFLTRCLGTELNGDYTYIINTANIISIMAGLGIYQSIPFFNRKNKDVEMTLQDYVNVFFFQFILYLFLLVLVWRFLPNTNLRFIIVLAIFDNVVQQLNTLMLVRDVYKRNRIFLCGAIFSLFLYGGCYFFNIRVLEITLVFTITIKIYYLIAYLWAIKKPLSIFTLSFARIKGYIVFGYLPMFTFLLINMNYKVDVIMLKWYPNVSNTQLSYYSLAVMVAEIVWIISDVFKDVIFAKTSEENHYDEVSAAIRVSNCLMVAIVLAMFLLGKPFIWIFYGKEFVEAYGIVVLLLCGVPFMSWFKILYPLFNALGKRWFSFSVLLIAVIANILINYILIPRFGIYGAAFASIVSYLICGISFLQAYAKEAGEKIWYLVIPKKQDFYKIFINRE